MSDLHERLDSAFAAVDPGVAPVEAVMRAGRKIRHRRRAGLLAGAAAVVVAAVVGVPALTHHQALPPPPTNHLRVTVNPPGPRSPAGLIASGLIGDARWSVSVESPRSKDCLFTGTGLSFFACNGDLGQPTAANPVFFEGASGSIGGTTAFVSFGQASRAVVAARVELSDGTVLTLHPAQVDGIRFLAFAIPNSITVDSLTVYGRGGEIATAIPYNAPDGFPDFADWLRPGQAVPARITGMFGSGTLDGRPWRATANLGPWGTCVAHGPDVACFAQIRPATGWVGGSSDWAWGTAGDSVSYLVITPRHGAPVRAEATQVGPQKFWGVPLSYQAQAGARWTAYDDAGQPVVSGKLSTQ